MIIRLIAFYLIHIMIQETIKNFLQQHHISRDAGFILAVSGGADSICMLHAFKYLNLKMLV